MPKVTQAAEFFVVGGPVQSERLCYVERAADRQLAEAIRERRLCCVLGPRAVGKSSLMHRTARTLRQAGELAALVDLAQLDARGASAVADRWLFGIAQRVAHELEIRIDLDAWWQEKAAVGGEQRLVDFFWAVVLTNTTAPVTVFLDEIDAALGLPFAADLFAAINACYARRTRDPDFARLTFVLLGCTSRRALAGNDRGSPLLTAENVEPAHFAAEEAYRLAVGFGGERDLAQALMDRVCTWTGGHPYLTQKVARGVARKGGKLEDVERVVREQLLAAGATADEPLLRHVRTWLAARTPPARRAAKLLGKLAAGATVRAPADPVVLDRLLLSGVVALDAERRCHFRSRIFKELLAGPWRVRAGFGARLAAAVAVLAIVGGAGAYWYLERLPQADVATLSNPASAAAAVTESYRRLRALPGFAERADGLWFAALERQSAAATTLAEATAVDANVRSLPGQDAVADRWLAAFWLRRAAAAADSQERDAALLLTQRAALLPTTTAPADAWLAELIGDDYLFLERSLRAAVPVTAWHMQFAQGTVLALDATQQLLRASFASTASNGALGAAPLRLTALRHIAQSRELAVDGDGTAGEFELTLALQHPAGSELLVTLVAPSGAEASIVVPRGASAAVETFVFPAAAGSALAALADEGRSGTWRLTLVDRRIDNVGALASWALRFGADEWRDAPTEPIAIADPERTDSVAVTTSGSFALARPEPAGAIGSIAVWNLAAGRLENDFALPAVPRYVAGNASGDRLLAATERVLTLWNVADGLPIARLSTETEFVLPPVFSTDGGYFAIAERVPDARPLYSVLRATDASLVGSSEGVDGATSWQLGPGARYAALHGPANVVRVLEPRGGGAPRSLPHARAVERLVLPADGAVLVTVVAGGEVLAWPLAATATVPRRLGVTTAAASASVAADGARAAFAVGGGGVAVVDMATGAERHRLGRGGAAPVTATQWSGDGTQLVSATAAGWRLWRLPAVTPSAPRAGGVAAATALALDRETEVVAVGLASGQLQVQRGVAAQSATALDFFGHRGAITTVAVNAERELAATGGNDGIVRLWDLATAAPTGAVMQPATAPIAAVALSADGRFVASATGRTVRVANVGNGVVVADWAVAADAAVLAFAADASGIAIGDASGTVTFAPLTPVGTSFAVAADAPVTALAFAPSGAQLAVGTAAGSVRLLRAADGTALGMRNLPQAVNWLDFNADGTLVLLATDAWLHALASTPALEPIHSRFVPRLATPAAFAPAAAGAAVRLVAVDDAGSVASTTRDLAVAPVVTAAEPLIRRDWSAVLGLRLNDAGEVTAFDP